MRYLGIDYGTKKIGLALSDELGTMGFPRTILPHTPRLVDDLHELIKKEHVGAIVMGESYNFSHEDNPIAEDVRNLARELTDRTGLAVYFEPETYTSAEARRLPAKEGRSRSTKKQGPVDASAAAIILTSYLQRTRHE